jgi:hypothetical protein
VAAERQPALGAEFHHWLMRVRSLAAQVFDLVALEVRLAALTAVTLLVLTIGSTLLLTVAWLALCGAGLAWLVAIGWSWPGALLLTALVNTALGVLGLGAVCRFSGNLCFKALRVLIHPEQNDATDSVDIARTGPGSGPAATPDRGADPAA